VVDTLAGYGEKTKYVLEVDGKSRVFDTKAERDAAAKKSI
jgi:hypothetical protein